MMKVQIHSDSFQLRILRDTLVLYLVSPILVGDQFYLKVISNIYVV